ncbi:MAG: hypothetical protein DRJ05_18985 [Bacteroidetes bacterium]|nr:MAG: hypothetical protein DRI89_09555 [Bacteroidota bacterium]RLD50926.1 MAG: hypothetical protein DRJ05_18985 [Bacteroidota bacterium]
MKKIKILFIALLFPVLAFSQGAEIIPFVGYMFGGSMNFYEGKYRVTDGMDYGVSVLVPVRDVVDVEINYTRMDSEGKFTAYKAGFSDLQTNMSTNYFQIGVVKAISKSNPKITPFGSFSLGATWFDFADYDDTWLFSITAGVGVKFMFSDHVGIMLRGRFMVPMFFGGLGFYAGTGGSGLSMNSYAAILQGDFNAGLIIKLGN